LRVVAFAQQDRPARAFFDQRDAAQDQRAHDALAEFGFRDDQRAQPDGRNQQRIDGFHGHARDERGTPRQLPDFSQEISRPVFDDDVLAAQPIALENLHASCQRNEHAGADAAGFEQQFTGFPVVHFAELAQPVDFLAAQFREHLVMPRRERREWRIGNDSLLSFRFLNLSHQTAPSVLGSSRRRPGLRLLYRRCDAGVHFLSRLLVQRFDLPSRFAPCVEAAAQRQHVGKTRFIQLLGHPGG